MMEGAVSLGGVGWWFPVKDPLGTNKNITASCRLDAASCWLDAAVCWLEAAVWLLALHGHGEAKLNGELNGEQWRSKAERAALFEPKEAPYT